MNLLKLPEEVKLNIFSKFTTSELFLLSFCSTATKSEVKKVLDARVHEFECMAGINWYSENNGARFVLSPAGSTCSWECQTTANLAKIPMEKCQLAIGKHVFNCGIVWNRHGSKDDSVIYLTNKSQGMLAPSYLFEYLQTLTVQPLTSCLTVNVPAIKHFIHHVQLHEPEAVRIMGKQMTTEDLEQLGEVWHKPNVFTIDGKVHGKWKKRHLNLFRTNNLVTMKGCWVKRVHLMAFDGLSLLIGGSQLSADDIIHFINKWRQGRDNQLHLLGVLFDDGYRVDTKRIIEKIKPFPFNPKIRDASYVYGKVSYAADQSEEGTKGGDILRDDGLLATIEVRPHVIYFFVWHDRFPAIKVPV